MTITVHQSSGAFHLCCEDRGYLAIAGPRLFRGGEIPDVQFTHNTRQKADEDCAKLQKYLDGLTVKKTKRKSTARSAYEE